MNRSEYESHPYLTKNPVITFWKVPAPPYWSVPRDDYPEYPGEQMVFMSSQWVGQRIASQQKSLEPPLKRRRGYQELK